MRKSKKMESLGLFVSCFECLWGYVYSSIGPCVRGGGLCLLLLRLNLVARVENPATMWAVDNIMAF